MKFTRNVYYTAKDVNTTAHARYQPAQVFYLSWVGIERICIGPPRRRRWWPAKCWLIRQLDALAGWLRRLP